MSSFLDFYPTEHPNYFFLSYNREDAPQIAPIARRLSQEGIPLWYDYGIAYSEKWAPQIAERIVSSQGVILFFTKGILAKDDSYVKKEYRIAKSRQKKVHIILLDKIADTDVPDHMLDWWFDITDQQCIPAYDLQPGKLISEIKRALGIEKQARPSYAAAAMEIFAQAPVNKTSEKLDPAEVLFRENAIIENGVLVKYTGSEAHVCIPNGVTTIGQKAFNHHEKLTSVTIPNSVTTIGEWAFSYCEQLTSVTIPNGVTSIDSWAFSGCEQLTSVTIPNGVTSIGKGAFSSCKRLTSVTIPNGVTGIANFAFSGCERLTSVTIPNGVTSIGHDAFSDCQQLTSVTIPDSVTTIGDSAFSGCYSLTSMTIPDNVNHIGSNPFSYCKKLTKIVVSPGNPHFIVENGHLIDKRTKTLITGCENAPIPENRSVRIIGASAFSGCRSLTSVTIPYGVSEIQKFAFSGCDSLRSVIIPGSVFKIEMNAFYHCESLRAVIFQGSCLTTIDWRAFEKCSKKLTIFAQKDGSVWKWARKNRIRVLEGGKDRQINLADYYRQLGLCQHCGGELKGILSKTCIDCGKKKDY